MALPQQNTALRVFPTLERVDPRDFAVNVEGIARAAQAPLRVADAVEDFRMRQNRRRIETATHAPRLELAVAEAGEAVESFPIERQIRDTRRQGLATRAPVEEGLATLTLAEQAEALPMERAGRRIQREGALERAPVEQQTLTLQTEENLRQFPERAAAAAAGTRQALADAEAGTERARLDRAIQLETGQDQLDNAALAEGQRRAQIQADTTTAQRQNLPRRTVMVQDETGVWREEQIVDPTRREPIVASRSQLQTPQQAEAAQLLAQQQAAERAAMVQLRQASAERAARVPAQRPQVRVVQDRLGRPISAVMTFLDPETGQPVVEEVPLSGGAAAGAPQFAIPGRSQPVVQPAAATATAQAQPDPNANLPVLTPEQVMMMPPGTRYRTTDGRIGTRP